MRVVKLLTENIEMTVVRLMGSRAMLSGAQKL